MSLYLILHNCNCFKSAQDQMKLNPFSVGGRDKKRQKDCHVSQRRSRVSKRGKKSARFQMHNQRISFVFLFSSRQRRISSFLKKPIHTTRIRPTLLFFVPPIRVVFSQFRRQFEIFLPFIMRGSQEKKWKDQQERATTTTRMTAEA